MSTPEPPPPQDEAAWLAALKDPGRAAGEDADARQGSLLGRLIRARFNSALEEVGAEPSSDLTRARLLAHARRHRPAARARWGMPLAALSGLAAGIVAAVLWFQFNAPGEFGAVSGAESIGSAPGTKTLEILKVQRYLIRSRDVAGTAAQLTAHLLRARAGLRVESKPDGRVQIDVEPLASIDADLARMAARLGVPISSGMPIEFTIQPP